MIKFTLSTTHPQRQYIQFKAEFEHDGSEHFAVQLPAWRPGRYELGNFAKLVRNFKVSGANSAPLPFHKTEKDHWKINGKGQSIITVEYEFYAAVLNAGSTFLDEDLLYVNPVNCFINRPGREEVDSAHVQLNVPADYILASPLADKTKTSFTAKNIHELLDSPFMTSADLQHHSFEASGCHFHIWINGSHELDVKKIEKDFIPFCNAQIRDFGDIPVDDYLFLFHFLAENSYHGVEHEKCTVITLGPAKKLLTDAFYEELLGVSSHELYHTWNVKALRPKDMLPYDYSKENYSQLGYVYEGVTTYLGDWYLMNSEVFDFNTYAKHLGQYLKRHFQNYGRFNYSVAESSFDTWLDGYTSGAPGRKVSIYTEGCLIAFLCDLMVLKSTNGQKNLASVMHQLWQNFGKKGLGYSADNYFDILASTAGISFSEIREQLVNGHADFKPYFDDILPSFGLKLKVEENASMLISKLGIKAAPMPSGEFKILDLWPNSPADRRGVHIGDMITAINGISEKLNTEINSIDFSSDITLSIKHIGVVKDVVVEPNSGMYFPNAELERLENPSKEQLSLFQNWRGDN